MKLLDQSRKPTLLLAWQVGTRSYLALPSVDQDAFVHFLALRFSIFPASALCIIQHTSQQSP